MGGLTQTVGTVHRLLRGEIDALEASRLLGAPENRLAVYAGFVKQHVRTALEKNYTALGPVLGRDTWDELVDRYFREHPPGDYELNAAASGFRAFLQGLVEKGLYGLNRFHLELAELEWQEWAVYASEVALPRPGDLTGPVLNPTLVILDLDHPVVDYLDAFRRRDDARDPVPPTPEPSRQTVFVFRHPVTLKNAYLKADTRDLFAFKMVHDGLTVAEAVREAGLAEDTVRGILDGAVRAGLVLAPETQ